MTSKPRLKRDWAGRYVMLNHRMETNGGAMFEAGEVMLVTRNWGGLHLEAVRACETCRLSYRFRIKKVSEFEVTLLSVDYKPGGEDE